jgi:hypothetical protein
MTPKQTAGVHKTTSISINVLGANACCASVYFFVVTTVMGLRTQCPNVAERNRILNRLFSGWPCIYMLRIICKYAWIFTSTSLSRHGIYRDITFTTPHRWFCYFLLNFLHDIILGSAKDLRWSELLPLFWSLCLLVALYGGETGEEQTYVSGCRR